MKQADAFWAYSRERHNVYLLRRDGLAPPWTADPVIASTGFCNVFRELDRVTTWFRQHIRGPLRAERRVVPWTVTFRWFNRIAAGEAMRRYIAATDEGGVCGLTGFDMDLLRQFIVDECGRGPYVTGSYMVRSPQGYSKLDGILHYAQGFWDWWDRRGQWEFYNDRGEPQLCLQQAHALLQEVEGLSGFTAYEVVTDLRHTGAVDPRDRLTWAHAGPGATRGGSRVLYGEPGVLSQGNQAHQAELRQLMVDLLKMSQSPTYWPQDDPDWPLWEMREVEHTLCEFDKHQRVKREQGSAKRVFRPGEAYKRPLPDAGLGGL